MTPDDDPTRWPAPDEADSTAVLVADLLVAFTTGRADFDRAVAQAERDYPIGLVFFTLCGVIHAFAATDHGESMLRAVLTELRTPLEVPTHE